MLANEEAWIRGSNLMKSLSGLKKEVRQYMCNLITLETTIVESEKTLWFVNVG